MAGIASKANPEAVAVFLGESGLLRLKEFECCGFTTAMREYPNTEGSLSTWLGGLIHKSIRTWTARSEGSAFFLGIRQTKPIRIQRAT
jgi:hypothetical protein